jgi:dephospho-CoA kinase
MATDSFNKLAPRRFSVGLTGGIGSGKTTVANLFADRGASIVDTDAIAHSLSAPDGLAIPAIRAQFGDDFINPDGSMNRARMRERVFSDPPARKTLEAILHPLIRSESDLAMKEAPGEYVIFVVPLLVESSEWRIRVARILVVDCPEDVQIRRVVARNGMSETAVRAIMSTQAARAERLAAADDVIVNDDGAAKLIPEVDRLHQLYKMLAAASKA